MFKTTCPNCNKKTIFNDSICESCGYNIEVFMKNHNLIPDRLFICPHCGTFDAGENSIRLKCYECGTIYKSTDILRKQYWDNIGQAIINHKSEEYEDFLLKRYVGDTINWDIYNAREDKWNKTQEEHHKYQQQKKTKEETHQDAINIHKCPTCGSTNIHKISTTRKVAGAIGFGLLSKTAKSQFECKNCGYKW